MNAVTCLSWVRRGVAKARPDLVQLEADEMEELIGCSGPAAETVSSSDEASSDIEKERKKPRESSHGNMTDSVEARYGLEDYDDDDDDEHANENVGFSMTGLSVFSSNQHDPYLSKDDQSSDDSDYNISPDDNLIAMCKVHGDFFSLEVWVSNVAASILFCHHDVILSNCPLAVEWIGFDPGESNASTANLVAIGSMSPDIELWDLDVVNSLEPAFVLKGQRKHKRKADGSKKVHKSRGHSDAVLALSWNCNRQQILASASVDKSVGVWDLSRGKVVSFLADHSDKVQAVQWHPIENQLLVSGSYDGHVRLFDCQSKSTNASRQWSLDGEVEKVIWDHHNPFYLFAGTDVGTLACIDVRSSSVLFSHQAHTATLSSLALSSKLSGCLVTASSDRSVKIWDVRDYSCTNLVHEKLCKIGDLHCLAACPDDPFIFCVGGDFETKLLNLRRDSSIIETFGVADCDAQESGKNHSESRGTHLSADSQQQ